MHQKKLNRTILKTLIYSDIFDYPLTLKELEYYLLGKFSISPVVIKNIKEVSCDGKYFFLTGRKELVAKRMQREKLSQTKYVIAKKVIRLLSFIPTIYSIGISGSLAMKNAEKSDDIDLFIICSTHGIWITRICTLFLLQLISKRRARNTKKTENFICTNMFITRNGFMLPLNKQNLFTAHEIAQVQPIFDRDNTYKSFFLTNSWIRYYLPHVSSHKIISQNSSILRKVFEKLFLFGEIPVSIMQYWYMKQHKTHETITNTMLAFHPADATQTVLMEYAKKLKQYGISI